MNNTSSSTDKPTDKLVLLFFKEFQQDKFLPYDRYLKALVKPVLKPILDRFHHNQKVTGFVQSLNLLLRALTLAGYDVRVNDYKMARNYPDHPVGLVGWPVLLTNWNLPNPAVLGPSLYDHPKLGPDGLMNDERYKIYLALADWTVDMYREHYGDAVRQWYAGIDTDKWPDYSSEPKRADFLIYDKIRWDHDEIYSQTIAKAKDRLDKLGLTYEEVRYKFHDHGTFRQLLKECRALLFFCEHETQGLAYQEAMACNLPVLAWDREYWADHRRPEVDPNPIPASSVPFFSPDCGERFKSMDVFDESLESFMKRRANYRPRDYVLNNLSFERSAKMYSQHYFGIAKAT